MVGRLVLHEPILPSAMPASISTHLSGEIRKDLPVYSERGDTEANKLLIPLFHPPMDLKYFQATVSSQYLSSLPPDVIGQYFDHELWDLVEYQLRLHTL